MSKVVELQRREDVRDHLNDNDCRHEVVDLVDARCPPPEVEAPCEEGKEVEETHDGVEGDFALVAHAEVVALPGGRINVVLCDFEFPAHFGFLAVHKEGVIVPSESRLKSAFLFAIQNESVMEIQFKKDPNEFNALNTYTYTYTIDYSL